MNGQTIICGFEFYDLDLVDINLGAKVFILCVIIIIPTYQVRDNIQEKIIIMTDSIDQEEIAGRRVN